MKTRYFIISSMICAVFAVYFLYYHAWMISLRPRQHMGDVRVPNLEATSTPSAQIDLLAQMANVAMIGTVVFLVLALVAAVLRGMRPKK